MLRKKLKQNHIVDLTKWDGDMVLDEDITWDDKPRAYLYGNTYEEDLEFRQQREIDELYLKEESIILEEKFRLRDEAELHRQNKEKEELIEFQIEERRISVIKLMAWKLNTATEKNKNEYTNLEFELNQFIQNNVEIPTGTIEFCIQNKMNPRILTDYYNYINLTKPTTN